MQMQKIEDEKCEQYHEFHIYISKSKGTHKEAHIYLAYEDVECQFNVLESALDHT